MDGQCQLYITNENPNENRNKYSRIIDKYSSISYVRQLRDNSLRVQTNSNYYKSQEERGKKISINLTSCSFYTRISYFFSLFPPQKLIKQTHATYVYPHLIHIAAMCRRVVVENNENISRFPFHRYISRVSISSYRARTRLLWISTLFFHFYFLVKSNSNGKQNELKWAKWISAERDLVT